jgi:predicted O-methyltransferase YrrM
MTTATMNDIIHQLETSPNQLRENWCVPRETGRFLHLMVLITGAKRIVEIGTSIGYSTLWLAGAARQTGGNVDTLEYFEQRQQQAIAHIREAGLSDQVSFHLGAALETLNRFKAEGRQFDLAFVDADKAGYIEYAKILESIMPSGACLIADNTRSHRDEMQDFLEYMERSESFDVAEIETPNGQLLARRR